MPWVRQCQQARSVAMRTALMMFALPGTLPAFPASWSIRMLAHSLIAQCSQSCICTVVYKIHPADRNAAQSEKECRGWMTFCASSMTIGVSTGHLCSLPLKIYSATLQRHTIRKSLR